MRKVILVAMHIAIKFYNCTFVEFLEWKSKVEKTTNVYYIKSSGMKLSTKNKFQYYYCSRSGNFNTRGMGKRCLKSQGTSKIDAYCTSKIVLQYYEDCIQANFVTTHYGHDFSVGHLRLSLQEREAIAGQLLQGVSFDHILDKVRDNIGPDIARIHLLVEKDLNNIEKAFNIHGWKRHSSDVISVHLWVKEMEEEKNSPVIFL